MASDTKIVNALDDLATATESANTALPESDALLPPSNGISLLDVKNELFLSYLQALALRNLNVVRSIKDGKSLEETQRLNDDITKKLVEHRICLERGVWPLEQKIKYQVDRVIKAADDEERGLKEKLSHKKDGRASRRRSSESGSEDSSDEGSDESGDEGVDASLHRPDPAGFMNGTSSPTQGQRSQEERDGVYRPPRISATSMPTTESKERKAAKPGRSATIDEYVSTELSHAPLAMPSIGSTIASGGRKNKDARQLAQEQERRDYEETHLMRLPKESKKERAKQQRRDRGGAFGGEDWRELGESVDRIGDLTKRKHKDSALDRSRKRRPIEDGPRDDGIGDAFNARKRRMMKKTHR